MRSPVAELEEVTAAVHSFVLPERQYSGFIFDCDGTLADSMPLHFTAWRTAFAAHGAPFDFTWDLFVRRAGKTLERTVEELNQEFGGTLDPDRVSAAQRAAYDQLLPGVRAVEPVVALARSLAGKRPMAVASGGDLPTVRRTLSALGILDLFITVVSAFEVEHGKPAPDLFLLAAERIGIAPSECLVFEDSLLGIEAAERAGMGAVLVQRQSPPPR